MIFFNNFFFSFIPYKFPYNSPEFSDIWKVVLIQELFTLLLNVSIFFLKCLFSYNCLQHDNLLYNLENSFQSSFSRIFLFYDCNPGIPQLCFVSLFAFSHLLQILSATLVVSCLSVSTYFQKSNRVSILLFVFLYLFCFDIFGDILVRFHCINFIYSLLKISFVSNINYANTSLRQDSFSVPIQFFNFLI